MTNEKEHKLSSSKWLKKNTNDWMLHLIPNISFKPPLCMAKGKDNHKLITPVEGSKFMHFHNHVISWQMTEDEGNGSTCYWPKSNKA